jgi:hypothetical protein
MLRPGATAMKAIAHAFAAGLCCFACGGAAPPAESPQSAASPVAHSEAQAVERAPETAENHRAATERLLEQMNMQQLLDALIETSLSGQVRANPQLAGIESTLREFFRKYMSWESLKDDMVGLYMEAYTQREIEDLLSFYSTPTGKKSIRLMPELAGRGAQIGQRRVQEHLPELQQAIGARIQDMMRDPVEPKKK